MGELQVIISKDMRVRTYDKEIERVLYFVVSAHCKLSLTALLTSQTFPQVWIHEKLSVSLHIYEPK